MEDSRQERMGTGSSSGGDTPAAGAAAGDAAPPSRPNRAVMDSMFVDLYARDASAPQNFLDVYNAIHGTRYMLKDVTIEPKMLDGVLYLAYRNDVVMLVNGRLVIFIEHQSTLNYNMPLRLLDYSARVYEGLVPHIRKFYRTLQKIPAPEFYVFYNGPDDLPEESELRLSDAFEYPGNMGRPDEPPLELVVRVYNINIDKGRRLLEKCGTLRQYAEFVALRRYASAHREDEDIGEPLTWAVREAVRRGILVDYLERKGAEVLNMLLAEYNYDEDVAAQREESREEGIKEGIKRGRREGVKEGEFSGRVDGIRNLMRNLKLTLTQAMDALGIQPEERPKYAALLA